MKYYVVVVLFNKERKKSVIAHNQKAFFQALIKRNCKFFTRLLIE